MVVNIKYYSFKDLDMKNRVPFIAMILIVLALAIVSWDPPIVLFIMAILYASSGPAMAVYARREKYLKKIPVGVEAANTDTIPDTMPDPTDGKTVEENTEESQTSDN
jgi:hypothetical protein